MGTIEKIVGTMLLLVALYLVLANSSAFNSILKGLSAFNIAVLGTLQGRYVEGAGVSVGDNATSNSNGSTVSFGNSFGGLSGGFGRL